MSVNLSIAISVICFTKIVFTMFKTDLKVNYNRPEFICSFT